MTKELELLKEIDPIIADVYKSKKLDCCSYNEIACSFNMLPSKVHLLYTQAKRILREGDFTWMDGLSNHAITQLLKTKYNCAESLKYDVLNGKVDLEEIHNIGHKIAQEIYRWCVTYKGDTNHLYKRRRSTDKT